MHKVVDSQREMGLTAIKIGKVNVICVVDDLFWGGGGSLKQNRTGWNTWWASIVWRPTSQLNEDFYLVRIRSRNIFVNGSGCPRLMYPCLLCLTRGYYTEKQSDKKSELF